ncbi:MAG: sensor histidine kinase [Phycisphaerae bacterium]|jgi:two-component system NarL family sensor kinase
MGDKIFLVSIDRDVTEQILNMGAHLKLMIASEEERRRLARELHDSICQGLVGLQLTVQTAAANARTASNQSALTHAAEKCGEMIREVRSICHGLYPPALESLGLVAALNQLVDPCRHVGVVGTVECPADLARRRFSSEVEIALYRIAQEAINNSLRHGKAKSIAVSLKVENGRLHLQVVDDGVGFDKDSVVSGLGLNTMRDRVEALKGMLIINSRPGRTVIKAKVPLVLPSDLPRPTGGRPGPSHPKVK